MNPHTSHQVVTFRPHDTLDRLFEIGVMIKGLDGLLELVGGLALLLITPAQIERIVDQFADSVLGQALPDTVAVWADAGAGRLTSSGLAFGAAYLLAHGALKVVLVAALLRNKLWAYPWMIVVLAGFVVYQGYELVVSPSAGLAVLTTFDIVVIALTWREYRRQRQQRRSRSSPAAGDDPDDGAPPRLSIGTPGPGRSVPE